MTDDEFIAALETCTLSPDDFNHAAHVRAGYIYLRRGEFGWAVDRMRQAIQTFAGSLGQAQRYHETITVACMALIREHIELRGDAGNWLAFANANPELFAPDLLARFYPPQQLAAPLARRTFVLPCATALR